MVLKILLVDLVVNYDLKPTDDPPRTREVDNIIFTDPPVQESCFTREWIDPLQALAIQFLFAASL